MTKKKAYKQLRKNLSKRYSHSGSNDYAVMGAIRSWIEQSGMVPTDAHVAVLCEIMGGVFYPYQKRDRKKIISYMKENEKWNR